MIFLKKNSRLDCCVEIYLKLHNGWHLNLVEGFRTVEDVLKPLVA